MPDEIAHPTDIGSAILGFDFGTRRIGVAIGNRLTGAARPLAVVDVPAAARWDALAALLSEWQPARLVVGIPLHPDGAPHAVTRACERFARQLEGRFRLPVARVDERYSSAVLDRATDDRAAAVILQQWLDESAAAPSPGAG
jgi:putative Holliday junction resolvase